MAARLFALLPRLASLTLIWLLATSTITFAAAGRQNRPPAPPAPAAPRAERVLVVPDVRHQAYVFAKSLLEDGGFGWRIEGSVKGFAANTVVTQDPAPGVKVIDTGAPVVVLHLERNAKYPERGLPENDSPYEATKLVLASEARKAARTAKAAKPAPAKRAKAAKASQRNDEQAGADAKDGDEVADRATAARKPDFEVRGAPAEPRDEMALPERARLLEKRVASAAKPTRKLVRYWLYQHSWIVTGARFGWHDGAEALRILIRVDEDLERRWGIGSRSAAVARAALAEVERKAGR